MVSPSGWVKLMRRREFITLFGTAATWPLVARAQPANKPRIGYLALTSADQPGHIFFRESLHQLGYVEEQNIALLERFADGNGSRLPTLAAELVRENVDVIVANSPPSIRAARDATRSVPIVMITGDDPVRSGYVASLARPGGNLTGVTLLVVDLFAKQMELLKQLIPEIKHVAILWDPEMPSTPQDLMDVRAAAVLLGLQLKIVEARGEVSYESAFATMSAARVEALLVAGTPTFIQDRSRIISLAAKHRLPAIYSSKDDTLVGGLMSYGARQAETIRLAVRYVDRILKGAKPTELPVEQPSKFDLVINVKTAKALGLTVPPTLLGRADEVIE
jgi:putative tryptophan/tyrosine transport system substrate-binding protein